MKQSSSTNFSAIPIDTNTLAGQWMTFSHMANHYRKLLNVKPRVDTGLVGQASGLLSNHSLSMQSSKTGKKMSSGGNKKSTKNNHSIYTSSNDRQGMYSSHPDKLNISKTNTTSGGKPIGGKERRVQTSSSTKAKQASQQQQQPCSTQLKYHGHHQNHNIHHLQDYQVVFGPSSIRSSTDAFMSDDTESTLSNANDKLPSEVAPIGVTEKIRRFLHHIHQLDLTTTSKPKRVKTTTAPPASKSERLVPPPPPLPSSVTAIVNNMNVELRPSRHTKCFLPYEPPSPVKSSREIAAALNKQKLTAEQLSSPHRARHFHQSPRISRRSENNVVVTVAEKELKPNKAKSCTRKKGGSVASIGTICGSEPLTAEDYPISIKDICSTLESGLRDGDDDDDDILSLLRMSDNHSVEKKKMSGSHKDLSGGRSGRHHYSAAPITSLLKSNSMANLVQKGGTVCNGNGGGSGVGGVNNKDSSRDSAYGFSSGESRITTRESTPEKKCHHNTNVNKSVTSKSSSHRDTHADLEETPCKDSHVEGYQYDRRPGSAREGSKEVRHNHQVTKKKSSMGVKTKSSYDLRRQDSSERYITFLAELTQDIVSKGIYTNKGLKSLFKTHMDQNKELNQDKLADMVERLRMDLGIPKDDALDKIEFGYGSITSTTNTTFFYRPPTDKLSMDSILSKTSNVAAGGDGNGNVTNFTPTKSTSTSPSSSSSQHHSTTVVVPNNKNNNDGATATSTTTGFSSPGQNTSSNQSTTEEGGDAVSVHEEGSISDKYPEEDFEDDKSDEFSLSESELSQALKNAGLDPGATEEVLGILKT